MKITLIYTVIIPLALILFIFIHDYYPIIKRRIHNWYFCKYKCMMGRKLKNREGKWERHCNGDLCRGKISKNKQ